MNNTAEIVRKILK